MTGFLGADTQMLREQGSAFTAGSRQIEDVTQAMSLIIDSVTWVGADAMDFKARWHSAIKPRLLSDAAEIHAKGLELEEQAAEQDATSSVRGIGEVLHEFFEKVLGTPYAAGAPLGAPGVASEVDRKAHGDSGGPVNNAGGVGRQEFFGGNGYGGKGKTIDDTRPIGVDNGFRDSVWDGREINRENGYMDFYGVHQKSSGHNSTTDSYGSTTNTWGARYAAEAGVNSKVDLGNGRGYETSANVGYEMYMEAGGTYGPDGYSAGARAGAMLYSEQSLKVHGEHGDSLGVTQSLNAGVEAHAHAYSHVTRNKDGEINGFTSGSDFGASAAASASQKYDFTAPGGWFSGDVSVSEKVGFSAGLGATQTFSTDEVSFSVGGNLAAALGMNGVGKIAVHPNAIVNSFTEGDYDIDDYIANRGLQDEVETVSRWGAHAAPVFKQIMPFSPF